MSQAVWFVVVGLLIVGLGIFVSLEGETLTGSLVSFLGGMVAGAGAWRLWDRRRR